MLDVSVDDKLLEELSWGRSSPTPMTLMLGHCPSTSRTSKEWLWRGSITSTLQKQKLFVRLQVYTLFKAKA